MPKPRPDEFEKERREALSKVSNYVLGADRERQDPVYDEITNLMMYQDRAYTNKARLFSLCYKYLYTHRNEVYFRAGYERLNAVLLVTGIFNEDLANKYIHYMNTNKDVRKEWDFWRVGRPNWDRKLPLDTIAERDALKIEWNPQSGRTNDVSPKDDVRIQNLETLQKYLTSKKLDPFYYKNSKEYKELLTAIKLATKYAHTSDKLRDDDVLENLLEDVSRAAVNYINAKDAEPSTALGKNRLEGAFAVLYSVDKNMAQKMLDANTAARVADKQAYADAMTNVFGRPAKTITAEDLPNVLTFEKIMKNPALDVPATREEMLAGMKEQLDEMAENLNKDEPEQNAIINDNPDSVNAMNDSVEKDDSIINDNLDDVDNIDNLDNENIINENLDKEENVINDESKDEIKEEFKVEEPKQEEVKEEVKPEEPKQEEVKEEVKAEEPKETKEERYAAVKSEMEELGKEMNHLEAGDSGAVKFTYRYENLARYLALRDIYEQATLLDKIDMKTLEKMEISKEQVEYSAEQLKNAGIVQTLGWNVLTQDQMNLDDVYESYKANAHELKNRLYHERMQEKAEPQNEQKKDEIQQPVANNGNNVLGF